MSSTVQIADDASTTQTLFTPAQREAVIAAARSINRRWGAVFDPYGANSEAAVIGRHAGGHPCAEAACGVAVVLEGFELLDVSQPWAAMTYGTLEDALQAMRMLPVP